jgi:hypothetical protein
VDLDRSTRQRPYPSHQPQVFNAVVAYGFLAPHILALDEAHERLQNDVTLSQHLATAASVAARRPLMDIVRCRLGGVLILIGTRLQGSMPNDLGVPTSPVAASAGLKSSMPHDPRPALGGP